MIVKISGEQPFQVLSTQFTIGPSSSGYDLYFSADGVNYSKLFTVAANTNRQVTQVAAGSYYKLSGNTGNVVVNWYGNCVSGGGGGGSYVLPVASSDTLGGIKVGSGLTIDSGGTLSTSGGSEAFSVIISALAEGDLTRDDYAALQDMADYLSGRTDMPIAYIKVQMEGDEPDTMSEGEIFYLTYLCPTEGAEFHYFEGNYNYVLWLPFEDVEETTITTEGGGSGESNYVIVSNLEDIEDPYEGLEAYVEAHTVSHEYTGLTLTTTETEDYVGFLYDGNGDQKAQVYISGSDFYWNWENDGYVHPMGEFFYKTKNEVGTFIFYVPSDDWYVEAHTENTVTGTTENYEFEEDIQGQEYRYNGEDWELMNNIRVFYLDNMSQEELADLYAEIFSYTENTFPAGRYHFYAFSDNNDEYRGWFEVYVARFYSGQPVSFSGHMQSRNNTDILMRGYELDYEGNFSTTFEQNIAVEVPYQYAYSVEQNDPGLTGVTHDSWATVWEGSKAEGFDNFSQKAVLIKIGSMNEIPFKFYLAKYSGSSEDESTMVLYFSGMQADYDTNTITVHKFSLTKDVNDDIYMPSALATNTYNASS